MDIKRSPSGDWEVTGAACSRGVRFAKEERTLPRRMLTSTLPVRGGHLPRVAFRSREAIPKEMLFQVLKSLRGKTLEAPIEPGDILVENVAETGIDLIATSHIGRKQS